MKPTAPWRENFSVFATKPSLETEPHLKLSERETFDLLEAALRHNGTPGACISGMRSVVCFLGLFLVATPTISATEQGLGPTTTFEGLADELKFFRGEDVNRVGDRRSFVGERVSEEDADKYWSILQRVRSVAASTSELSDLLRHKDPKVRTLAIAALFWKSGPKALPEIVSLVDDASITFSRTEIWGSMPYGGTGKVSHLRLVHQTVGQVAECAVRVYLESAGYFYGTTGHSGKERFVDYWEAHKDRAWCASWFAVQLQRASHRVSPTLEEYVKDIHEVRNSINKLPEDDRAWTLLWLFGEPGSDRLVSEAELLAFCKKLGPERLLRMLQRKPPSDDPDLQPRPNNNWPFKRMELFVLRHAGELLWPEDSDALLACDAFEMDNVAHQITDPTITPYWAIAASKLQPENALPILHAAFDRFRVRGYSVQVERSELAVALFRAGGPSEFPFLVNWFYEEAFDPKPGPYLSECYRNFLKGVSEADQTLGKAMIAAIVKNERFKQIDFDRVSMQQLTTVVNRWSGKVVISPEELVQADQPGAKLLKQGLLIRLQSSVDQWQVTDSL